MNTSDINNIKNVYHMLAYAFRRNLTNKEITLMNTESFDNIYDLFGMLLTSMMKIQVKNGLTKTYNPYEENTGIIKGRIDFNQTIKKQTQVYKKVICIHDDFNENNLLNQIIKTTMLLLIKSKKVKKDIIKEIKSVLIILNNVDEIDLRQVTWSKIKYNNNNKDYRFIIEICKFILDGLIVKKGNDIKFMNFIDDQKMHQLFENFVRAYFEKHFPELVYNKKEIKWFRTGKTLAEAEIYLPKMRADIILESKIQNRTLIIDTKYYSKMLQTHFEKETYKSHNLYQIFTYVKNKEKETTNKVEGMLLYAEFGEDEFNALPFEVDGNKFYVTSLNLNLTFNDIKNKLNRIANNLQTGQMILEKKEVL